VTGGKEEEERKEVKDGKMHTFVPTHVTLNFLISHSERGREDERVMVSWDPAVMLPFTSSGQYWAHFSCVAMG